VPGRGGGGEKQRSARRWAQYCFSTWLGWPRSDLIILLGFSAGYLVYNFPFFFFSHIFCRVCLLSSSAGLFGEMRVLALAAQLRLCLVFAELALHLSWVAGTGVAPARASDVRLSGHRAESRIYARGSESYLRVSRLRERVAGGARIASAMSCVALRCGVWNLTLALEFR